MATAGAWPQEQGHWFVSSGVELGYDPELYALGAPLPVQGWSASYIEYGLTERLTVTFDYGRAFGGIAAADTPVQQQAYLLLRWDLAPKVVLRRAISVGIGTEGSASLYHLGLHLGRGFDGRIGSGWMNLDLAARGGAERKTEISLDGTIGLNRGERFKLMLGLNGKISEAETPSWKIIPGLVVDLNRLELELGVIVDPAMPEESRLKLAIWQRF